MAKLILVVPASRAYCGRGVMLSRDGRVIFGPFRALAAANARVARRHENPSCDPLLPFGHTPAGGYVVAGSLPPGRLHRRRSARFGDVGALVLRPASGQALASVAGGRSVFPIHGGPVDDEGRLFATRGGIRLADADMSGLLRAVNAAQRAGDALSSVEIVEATPDDLRSVPTLDLRATRRRLPPRGGAASRSRRGEDWGRRRALLRATLLLVGGLSTASCDGASDVCRPCERGLVADGGMDARGLTGGLDAGAPATHCHHHRFECTDTSEAVFYSDVDVTGSTDGAGDYSSAGGTG